MTYEEIERSKRPFAVLFETGDKRVVSSIGKITRTDLVNLATQLGTCVANSKSFSPDMALTGFTLKFN